MNPKTAQTVASIIMLGFMLVGGYYVRNIPAWIRLVLVVLFFVCVLLFIVCSGGRAGQSRDTRAHAPTRTHTRPRNTNKKQKTLKAGSST